MNDTEMISDESFDSDDETLFDLSKKDTKVWLVKVPTFLMQKWEETSEQELGKVRIYKKYLLVTQACQQIGPD
jgi:TFIIF, beta subunit N-terminus